MRRVPKLRDRATPARRLARANRQMYRVINEQDRDTQKWAGERRVPAKFADAKAAGRRTTDNARTHADRLATLRLMGA